MSIPVGRLLGARAGAAAAVSMLVLVGIAPPATAASGRGPGDLAGRRSWAAKALRLPHAPGELIVKFRGTAGKVAADQAVHDAGMIVADALEADTTTVKALGEEETLAASLAALSADPAVEYAEPNYLGFLQKTPNDPRYASMWGLQNARGADIGAESAWDVTTGSEEVVVGVMDSGCDIKHEDLAENIYKNPGEVAGNGVDDDGNGYVDDVSGWDAYRSVGEIIDTDGHGTHVSGTIGARGDNGKGVTGVNWRVKLLPLRIGPGPGVDSFAAIRAIDYAIALKSRGVNVRVLNNSWGGTGALSSLLAAIRRANTAGILVVCASGNDGTDNDVRPFYPACYDVPNVISVGAMTSSDTRASFSNYGRRTVDVYAPGFNILSTLPKNGYGNLSGTSMASPHVAGIASLVVSAFPDISVMALKARVLGSINGTAYAATTSLTGGRASASRALRTDATPPAALSDLRVSGSALAIVRLDWTAVGDDGTTGAASYYDIRYSNQPITGGNYDQATQIGDGRMPLEAGAHESASILSCAEGGDVYVAMRVYDKGGNFAQSASVQIGAGEAPPDYALTPGPTDALPTGTPLGLKGDDEVAAVDLPFAFPFYGGTFTRAYVSTNGIVTFDAPAIAPPGSVVDISRYTAVAPLWFDLTTDGKLQGGEDVYVESTPERVVIRWAAEKYYEPGAQVPVDAQPVTFAVALGADGSVDFQYGPGGNKNLFTPDGYPVVGLSDGGCSAKMLDGYNQNESLVSAPSVTLTPFVHGGDGAPILRVPSIGAATEGLPMTATFGATDPEGGTVTLSASLPRNATFDPATGVLAFTPDSAQAGFAQVVIAARDANGNVASRSFAIRVNNNAGLPEVGYVLAKKKVTIGGSGFQSGAKLEIDGTLVGDAKPAKKSPSEKITSAAAAQALAPAGLHTVVVINPNGVRSGPFFVRK